MALPCTTPRTLNTPDLCDDSRQYVGRHPLSVDHFVARHGGLVFGRSRGGGNDLHHSRPGSATCVATRSTALGRGGVMLAQAEHLAFVGAAIVAGMMLVLWIIHLLIRNAAIVDVGWAAGLGIVAIFYAVAGSGYHAR